MAVGSIDGTYYEIYRPSSEPQEQFYSGHRCYHCINTQFIVDLNGMIRYIGSGYEGHFNDARQYGLMLQIGTGMPFPSEFLLLADKIYPNRGSVMTPCSVVQLARKPTREQHKCRILNRHIRKYRIGVEHDISEIKIYRSAGTLRRHLVKSQNIIHTCMYELLISII